MCALWKVYHSGRWGWEQDLGYVLAPADRIDWVKEYGSIIAVDQVFEFDFGRMPDSTTIHRIMVDYEARWRKRNRPSKFERMGSKRPWH